MDNLAPGPLKPRLPALVAQGQAEQQAFIAQLSDAQRAALGTPAAWAAKDHIAHNTAWKADAARVIAAGVRGETPAPSPDETEFNPRVFAAAQHRSWEAILAGAALRAALEACSEAGLSEPTRFPWRQGRPLWRRSMSPATSTPSSTTGNSTWRRATRRGPRPCARRRWRPPGSSSGKPRRTASWSTTWAASTSRSAGPADRSPRLGRRWPGCPLRAWIRDDPERAALHAAPAFQALVADAGEGGTANDERHQRMAEA